MTASLQTKKSKNGKNYYYVVLSYKDIEGKWRTKWVSTSLEVKNNKKEAKACVPFIIDKYSYLEHLSTNLDKNISFCDYINDFKESLELRVIENTLERSTYEGYLGNINHIINYFSISNPRLVDVTPKAINNYLNYELQYGKINPKTKERGPLAIRSVRGQKNLLHAIFMRAISIDALIKQDPTQGIRVGTKTNSAYQHDEGFMTMNEAIELLQYVKDNDKSFYYVVLLATIYGLRRSELRGLRWSDIDFKKEKISISNVIVRINTTYEKSPKTIASRRELPLISKVSDDLLELKQIQENNAILFGNLYQQNDYILKWDDGHPFSLDYMSKHFSKIAKKYGRSDLTLHKLRHTCCSILSVELGYPLKVVQMWMGHSDMQTTMNTYTHAKELSKNEFNPLNDKLIEIK